MRVVVSLSGGGLAIPGVEADTLTERRYVCDAARGLADLAGRHELAVMYGSGPHLDLLVAEEAQARVGSEFAVAAIQFVEAGGEVACIGPWQDARAVLDGNRGFVIVPDSTREAED
jgi:carbamate kinase